MAVLCPPCFRKVAGSCSFVLGKRNSKINSLHQIVSYTGSWQCPELLARILKNQNEIARKVYVQTPRLPAYAGLSAGITFTGVLLGVRGKEQKCPDPHEQAGKSNASTALRDGWLLLKRL